MPITLQIAKTTTTSPAPLLPGKFKALDPKSWMMETEQVKPKVVCWRFSLYTFCFKSKVAKIDVHFFWQGKPWQPPSIFRIWNNTEQQLHPSSRRPQGRRGASHQAGARAHGGNRAEAGGGTTGTRESGPVALVFKCNMNFSLRWCLRVLEETERTILIPKVAVWKSGNFIRSIFWPKCWICLGFANVVLLDFESGFDKTSTFGDLWFRTDYSWHFHRRLSLRGYWILVVLDLPRAWTIFHPAPGAIRGSGGACPRGQARPRPHGSDGAEADWGASNRISRWDRGGSRSDPWLWGDVWWGHIWWDMNGYDGPYTVANKMIFGLNMRLFSHAQQTQAESNWAIMQSFPFEKNEIILGWQNILSQTKRKWMEPVC